MRNMNIFMKLFAVFIVALVGADGVWHEGWKSNEKGQETFLSEEFFNTVDNGDIIDLDDSASEVALTKHDQLRSPEVKTFGEDTREPGPDEGIYNLKNDIIVNEGELITPVPYIFETDDETENVTSHSNETDDEDLTSGSGSGEIVIEIEDATDLFNLTEGNGTVLSTEETEKKTADTIDYIFPLNDASATSAKDTSVSKEDTEYTPFCEEFFNVTWAPWSPWIRSGDASIRFRRCPVGHGYENTKSGCHGDYFEVRPCTHTDKRICRTSSGEKTEEYHVTCDGVDMRDVIDIDELQNPQDRADNCEYSLYDVTYGMMIGEPVNSDVLQTRNPDMWCKSDDKYIPFHTPTEQCRRILKSFCKFHGMCKYDNEEGKEIVRSKGEINKTCWKEFVLGGILPTGFPDQAGYHMICQRFDKESKLGKALGHKHTHFATLYDTKFRIPVVSMVTLRALGDSKWPHVPYMIERGLIDDAGDSVISWFFKTKKRGITRIDDLTSDNGINKCKLGKKQALPEDFDRSGYRIAHLLSPEIIGNEMNKRMSVFTLTNTIPIEPTIYPRWQYIQEVVRNFAINECHIDVMEGDRVTKRHRNGHDLPEVYILSGAAFSSNHIEVIGNDVTVPKLVWLAACCAHGADVSSFGVYMYNSFEQMPYVVSIENLQLLLQSAYYDNVDVVNVDLFPAFDGVCGAPEHDYSYNIKVPY